MFFYDTNDTLNIKTRINKTNVNNSLQEHGMKSPAITRQMLLGPAQGQTIL